MKIGGMSEFEIRAQEAELQALERGHVLRPWEQGHDNRGRRKWIASCRKCEALVIVEYASGAPAISGMAVQLSCEQALNRRVMQRKRRADQFKAGA